MQEFQTMKRLFLSENSLLCPFYDASSHAGRFYFTMQLLGPNVVELRKSLPDSSRDLHTAKRMSKQMLLAIEMLHAEGLCHRDIKPANFALSKTRDHLVLIDFGLARRYIDAHGDRVPERPEVEFKGSQSYASVSALEGRDQGPRDDVWGWFFSTVDLVSGGSLPWRMSRINPGQRANTDEILKIKTECLNNPEKLTGGVRCPQALVDVLSYLGTLSFSDLISYSKLQELIDGLDNGVCYHHRKRTEDKCQLENSIMADSNSIKDRHSNGRKRSRSEKGRSPERAHSPSSRKRRLAGDESIQYRNTLDLVCALRAGGASRRLVAAVDALLELDPAEGLGALCCFLDSLSERIRPDKIETARAWMKEVVAFAKGIELRLRTHND